MIPLEIGIIISIGVLIIGIIMYKSIRKPNELIGWEVKKQEDENEQR